MPDQMSLDGLGPLPVRTPRTVPELGNLVREAAAAGQGVYPFGRRTALHVGLPPTKPGVMVETVGLSGVVDYPARDMTVTVRAGTTVEELQRVLGAEGQRLPVDLPPGTVGGCLAANASGPRRLGWGTLRDYVIGISFVTDEGHEVKGGGRVVKNVAGYDLMKLHIGALGTLGVITQVTFKVTPKPEEQALIVLGLTEAAVGPTLDRLHASASRPVAVELLDAGPAFAKSHVVGTEIEPVDPWVILVGFEGKAQTVAWQVATLRDELKAAPVRELAGFRGADCDGWWRHLTPRDSDSGCLVLKATVPPSRVAAFAAAARATHPWAEVQAHAGNGIVYVRTTVFSDDSYTPQDPPFVLDRAQAAVADLSARAAEAGGSVTVRKCPVDWKKVLPVWGRPRGDWELMRRVKRTLDPKNVFNPGRLFGDL